MSPFLKLRGVTMDTVYEKLRRDADIIVKESIKHVLPDTIVTKTLDNIFSETGDDITNKNIYLAAIGKAAWQMAYTACEVLKEKGIDLKHGIIVTKYGHIKGKIENVECFEGAHPVSDENSYNASLKIIDMARALTKDDILIFLISGGGSALFEYPMISGMELQSITSALLKSGADINEINTVRKHLSLVKGGKFAEIVYPAKVYSCILSDVLGDKTDTIASGPTCPDTTTSIDALNIIKKYGIKISEEGTRAIMTETPKKLTNATNYVSGSVKEFSVAAKEVCERMGYKAEILDDSVTCIASDAGRKLAHKAKELFERYEETDTALIIGGETVVHVTGNGKGGRNSELALSGAEIIKDLPIALFSVGSDGTDGPTDAAGGYTDGETYKKAAELNLSISDYLKDNDSYNFLKQVDGLIFTGPTGTNVNDVSVALIKAKQ